VLQESKVDDGKLAQGSLCLKREACKRIECGTDVSTGGQKQLKSNTFDSYKQPNDGLFKSTMGDAIGKTLDSKTINLYIHVYKKNCKELEISL